METLKFTLRMTHRAQESSMIRNIAIGYRIIFLLTIVLTAIYSFVSSKNLFTIVPLYRSAILLVLFFLSFACGKPQDVPVPVIIDFFEEYLTATWPEAKNGKTTIKQTMKMYYKDVEKCEFLEETQDVFFFGLTEVFRWNYLDDTNVENKPFFHKVADSGIFINVKFEKTSNWVKAIEENSPIKVLLKT